MLAAARVGPGTGLPMDIGVPGHKLLLGLRRCRGDQLYHHFDSDCSNLMGSLVHCRHLLVGACEDKTRNGCSGVKGEGEPAILSHGHERRFLYPLKRAKIACLGALRPGSRTGSHLCDPLMTCKAEYHVCDPLTSGLPERWLHDPFASA